MTQDSLIKLLKRQMPAHGSWKDYATHLGISAQYLHDCKEGRRRPGKALLKRLGLTATIEYRSIKGE